MSRIRMAGSCGMIHRILRTLKTPSFVLTPSLHGESKHDETPPTVEISHKANKKNGVRALSSWCLKHKRQPCTYEAWVY